MDIGVDGLATSKWVRIMCDYRCDGIWDHEGLARSVDELPISGTLNGRLLAWQDWFDALDDQAAEDQTAVPLATWQDFVAAGLAIARDLKRELPDWTVVYFDEIERRTIGSIESAYRQSDCECQSGVSQERSLQSDPDSRLVGPVRSKSTTGGRVRG